MDTLAIVICEDAADAIKRGYNYSAEGAKFRALFLEKAVVVKNGTSEGNSTVDLILRDENGQQYVAMVTGRLLNTVPLFLGPDNVVPPPPPAGSTH